MQHAGTRPLVRRMQAIDQAPRARQWPTDKTLAKDLKIDPWTIRRDLEAFPSRQLSGQAPPWYDTGARLPRPYAPFIAQFVESHSGVIARPAAPRLHAPRAGRMPRVPGPALIAFVS